MNPFRPDNAQRAPGANRGLILTLVSCAVLVMAVACGTTNTATTTREPRPEGTRAAEVSAPTAEVSAPTPVPTDAPPPAVTPEYARLAAPDATAAAADPQVQTPADPAPAAAAPATDPDAAPCAPGQIKGNRKSHIFHVPGGQSYARTHANVQCFDTAAQATAAGYRAAKR